MRQHPDDLKKTEAEVETEVKAEVEAQTENKPASYEVGYGRPPVASRFGQGRPLNRRGRPRGASNRLAGLREERLKAIVLEEAYRNVTVNDGQRKVTLPMAKAIIRALALSAAKGQPQALRLFTLLLTTVEQQNNKLHDNFVDAAITYKTEWEEELRRRERLKLEGLPEPMPHPDHVIIDRLAGTVRIVGSVEEEREAENSPKT